MISLTTFYITLMGWLIDKRSEIKTVETGGENNGGKKSSRIHKRG
jgi:hypothetical protein